MSFWRLYYHLVWATKNREPLIQPKVEKRLFPYLVNKAAELGVHVHAVNGWDDHVHLIVAIPPKHAVAQVVKTLKGASAYDLNHTDRLDRHFAWQRGYGVLSLGEMQRSKAIAYVERQKEHHRQQTTNGWLERFAEFDEGPDDMGLVVGSVPSLVREKQAQYKVLGEPPF